MSDPKSEAEFESGDVERARAERFVDSILPSEGVLKVLDIKAGEQRFEIREPIYVVGVDVVQAERGRRRDADEHRVMDLEQVDLESQKFDVVLCINVLEHAREPLRLFPVVREALKPKGVFVVVLPNVVSVKGFLARLTPWSVHRWFYAHVHRANPDERPAPSVHSLSLRPSSLRAEARSGGWKLEYFRTYEGPVQKSVRRRLGVVGWRWRIIVALTRVSTLGLLSAEDTGIIAILTKIP
ncbi:MAG: class I SAM-dependent methyltransferase [Gaiellaceae bacterium]